MNQSNALLVVKEKNLYFFQVCTQIDIIAGHQLLEPSVDAHFLAPYSLVIFLDNGFEQAMANKVRNLSDAQIILFFWNRMRQEKVDLLEETRAKQSVDEIYSFDPIEAKQFNMKHNSTFYSKKMDFPFVETQYDIFFGASNNGRKERANLLRQRFEELSLTSYYHLLNGRGNEQEGYLSYTDYLKLMAKGGAILEIMRPGQTGITLRSLESIYFQKKLITDNPKIRFYYFYHPDNIFILHDHNLEDIPAFLQIPYRPVDPTFLDFYDAHRWAERFRNPNEEIFEQVEYHPQIF